MKKFLLKFILIYLTFIVNLFATTFDIKARTAILQDYLSGQILYEKEPNMKIFPASMTKIMTAIVTFDLLKSGDLNLEDKFFVSENAWRWSQAGYSSMFIMVDDQVSVEDLLRGIIVASGNDACIALAEGIAGTEEEFALIMTSKAKEIGMENTNFSNSSGITSYSNYSTVKDVMIMSNYLIKNYPEYYKYFKETEFTWDRTGGDPITQGNRNPLLYKKMGVDGIKTGYLSTELYSLASSLKRNERRIIAVASGFKTKNSRSKESAKLLTWGLTHFDTIEVYNKNHDLIELDVWLGKSDKVKVHLKNNIYKTIKKAKKKHLKIIVEYNGPIKAPIKKNDILGKYKIYFKNELLEDHDIYASEDIKILNIFSRIIKSVNYLVWGDV